jgi:hypothetical protein
MALRTTIALTQAPNFFGSLQAIQSLKGLEKGFLGGILGLLAVAGNHVGASIDILIKELKQHLKGRAISLERSANDSGKIHLSFPSLLGRRKRRYSSAIFRTNPYSPALFFFSVLQMVTFFSRQ